MEDKKLELRLAEAALRDPMMSTLLESARACPGRELLCYKLAVLSYSRHCAVLEKVARDAVALRPVSAPEVYKEQAMPVVRYAAGCAMSTDDEGGWVRWAAVKHLVGGE